MSKSPENALYRTSPVFKKRITQLIYRQNCTSKKEFAALVGVSEPTITRATLDGIIPTVPVLVTIADALEISVEYLLGRSDHDHFAPARIPASFHIRIEQLKRERNTNYGEICKKMRFPRTYFYEWLKEKTFPCVDYLVAIADYFGVSADYLLGRTDSRLR